MTEDLESPPDAPVLITAPADGLPPIVDTEEALARTLDALAAGTGPVAVDTERAQGFRYSGKAYLIQLRRTGSGTHLVDPIAFEGGRERADLSALREAAGDAEWIIHAATQDLGCLDEVGLAPDQLFDTELAGRRRGLPRGSLGALTEAARGQARQASLGASRESKRRSVRTKTPWENRKRGSKSTSRVAKTFSSFASWACRPA